jgi:anti-sigma factor RsiW
MHESIRRELENLLVGKASAGDTQRHLVSCGECAAEMSAMRAQNELFHSMRAGSEAEPPAGFYARVMQRIEEGARDSIWSVFVYSPFGKRLALASLSIAVLLGSYVVAQERIDGHLSPQRATRQLHYDAPMEGDQAQLRDAVLVNFAQPHDGGFK